jgi:hypothetical protein
MHLSRTALVFGVLAALMTSVGSARGDGAEFTIAGGGTQLQLDDGGELDGQWGPWVQPSISFSPLHDTPQLRLGGGISLGWFSADVDNEFISGQADLFLFTPEFLASWRQPISNHFYLEPGVGVGAVIGALDFVGAEWGAGYSVRPFVRLGYRFDSFSTGIEAAYRFGHLELGGADGEIQNLSVGVFFALKL